MLKSHILLYLVRIWKGHSYSQYIIAFTYYVMLLIPLILCYWSCYWLPKLTAWHW